MAVSQHWEAFDHLGQASTPTREAKRETRLPLETKHIAKLGNIVGDAKSVKHFLVSEQQMFPMQLNWETFASSTMFPSLARPLSS